MSAPSSRRWVANEWRNVWQVTRLGISAARAAASRRAAPRSRGGGGGIARRSAIEPSRAAPGRPSTIPIRVPAFGYFRAEPVRERHADAVATVVLVEAPDPLEVREQRSSQPHRKRAAPVARRPCRWRTSTCRRSKSMSFTRSRRPSSSRSPAAVEQRRHEPVARRELREHRADLVAAEHDRNRRAARARARGVEPFERAVEHGAVEEEQRAKRLVLGRTRRPRRRRRDGSGTRPPRARPSRRDGACRGRR